MKLAFFTALAVILARVILFYTGHSPEGVEFMPVHLLVLVLVPFLAGNALLKREPQAPFPVIMREAFKAVAIYAIFFSLFIWIYYKAVDVVEFPSKINERVEAITKAGADPVKARTDLEQIFNPFGYASITFFALLIVGAIDSFVVSLLQHKFMRRVR